MSRCFSIKWCIVVTVGYLETKESYSLVCLIWRLKYLLINQISTSSTIFHVDINTLLKILPIMMFFLFTDTYHKNKYNNTNLTFHSFIIKHQTIHHGPSENNICFKEQKLWFKWCYEKVHRISFVKVNLILLGYFNLHINCCLPN